MPCGTSCGLWAAHPARFSVGHGNSARFFAAIALLLSLGWCCHVCAGEGAIDGLVRDGQGPVAGAVVRVQATDISASTDEQGRFTLTGFSPGQSVCLTAWAPGYYIGGGESFPIDGNDVEITLKRHASEDDPTYRWVSAFAEAGDTNNCQNCHSDPNDSASHLPFDQWRHDSHAKSAVNPRFLTIYSGTDILGNQSPPTRYGYNRDYGRFPLRPDPNAPYYGPGYKLDFPATAGNCAACHTPAAAIDEPYGVDPTELTGVGAEGIGCDFCHKVWDVRLNPATGMPYDNMPGVLSFEFRRPPEGHQFFAGPFDDVAPGEDTYSPIQNESAYCAPCHTASFWGTKVYDSFGEWLASPYSDPNMGQTCQDCHMPAGLTDHFARLDKGAKHRDPNSIFSHLMPGASDERLLRDAVSLTAEADLSDRLLTVQVEIVNDRTGHHVPTDSPLRQMILLVRSTDAEGNLLAQTAGPILPDWAGVGEPNEGYYAGL
ncbi:MAG: carboxypeptidase regulatory-like domain-containing protein, partial [Planctomycetota bacterium]